MKYEQMREEVGIGQHTSWHVGGISFAISTIRGDTRHYVDGKPRDEAFFRDCLSQVQPGSGW